MKIYKVDLDYIKFLYQSDNRVQYNSDYNDSKNENRPYIGIVLSINGLNYFAPLEHPRPKHANLKSNPHIYKIKNGRLGLIGLNNMIPVPVEALISFDIKKDPNSAILQSQYVECKNNWNVIQRKANDIYRRRTIKPNKFEQDVYCDFKLLETECKKYISTKGYSLNQNSISQPSLSSIQKNAINKAKQHNRNGR